MDKFLNFMKLNDEEDDMYDDDDYLDDEEDVEPAPKPQEANITLTIIAITKRIFFIIFNLFSLYKRGVRFHPHWLLFMLSFI